MKEKLPMISVIIPVYKVEKYLDGCIESVLAQTYDNLEIILVDDGSPDNCPQMCEQWAERDARIKVLHKPNGGASTARNAGLNVATGEYIGFVDSDDYIDKDMYLTMFNAIRDTGIKMACCASRTVRDNSETIYSSDSGPATIKSFSVEEATDEIFSFSMGTSFWRRLIHASVFEGLRFPEGEINEEYPLLIPVTKRAGGTAYVEKKLYYYRDRSDGVTGTLHKSLKTLICVKNNLTIMHQQISDYDLKNIRYFPFFIAKNSYFMLLSIVKNYQVFDSELTDLYNVYLKMAKENKKAFLTSEQIGFKDKVLFRLILSGLYKKMYLLRRKQG